MKKFERNIYLENKDLDEAVKILKENLADDMKVEIVDICDSLDRVSSDAVFALVSSPFYNSSAMDGICVCFENTSEADEQRPLELKKGTDFEYVNTGNEIKKPYNAVIMIEDIVEIDDDTIQIFTPASPWQHIRNIGEDIVASEIIIPAYHKIRPVDIGALIAGGIKEISVIKKPVVAIIPTGSEIIDYKQSVETGKILDSNSRMFEAMIKKIGGEPNIFKPVKDDYELIKQAVLKAVKSSDIVVIGAGSSAGTKDYTKMIISDLGELLFHGVAIKPGKPTVFGKINNKCVFGIPGYPVSSYFAFDLFVNSSIQHMLKTKQVKPQTVDARITTRVYSALKHLEFVRVKLGRVAGDLVAAPLSRGAGVTMSLVQADGILKIDKNSEGYEADEPVCVELLRDIQNIENTLVSVGSHDVVMDMINSLMHKGNGRYNLSSSHVGSMGGILAFRKSKCHIAPIHLLDEQSGEYNISAVEKYLKDTDCVLVKGIKRMQGIMVNKDSDIKCIDDIAKKGVVFVNRQKGSGTRVLVDYLLKKQGISPSDIDGYSRELNTHMMIASAVKSKSADVGVGVKSVATTMDLDFYPIGYEDYDFVVRKDIVETDMFKSFLSVLKSDDFKSILEELGGYKTQDIGKIIEL